MAFQLPQFLVLKSYRNERYLQYIHQDIEGLHGILQSSGEEVVSPYAKFQVEAATTGSNLVHIRSCYNNKYLRRADPEHWWIVAGADEPQADQTLWSCTLFEPELVLVPSQPDRIDLIRLRHVQLGRYIMPFTVNEFRECLFASQAIPDPKNFDAFTFIDREALVNLPKHLTFKAHAGGYLCVKFMDGQSYLQFSDTDLSDPTVANEVFITGDGNVRIKSTHTLNLWRRNSTPTNSSTNNWIWADSNHDTANNSDVNTFFFPVKVSKSDVNVIVALRNLGNNNFCKRFTFLSKISCLNATLPTLGGDEEAHLEVKELVLSRTISNLNFRLADARIYNRNTHVVLATGTAENHNQQTASATILLSYVDTKDSTWNTSADDVAFTSLIPTTLTSATLFVVQYPNKENIEALANFSGAYQWGQTHTSNTQIASQFPVVVPPMTKVKVSLLATRASCDIPFCYSQQDILIREHQPIISYQKEGGVYTGVGFSNFRHVREEERLPQA